MSNPILSTLSSLASKPKEPQWGTPFSTAPADSSKAYEQALKYNQLSAQNALQNQAAAQEQASRQAAANFNQINQANTQSYLQRSDADAARAKSNVSIQQEGDYNAAVERMRDRGRQIASQRQQEKMQKLQLREQKNESIRQGLLQRDLETTRAQTQRDVAQTGLQGTLGAARYGATGSIFSALLGGLGASAGSSNARFWG